VAKSGRPGLARDVQVAFWDGIRAGLVLGGGGWAAAVVDGAQVGEAGKVEGGFLAVGRVGDLELQGSGAWARHQGLNDGGDPGGLARAEHDRIRNDPVIVTDLSRTVSPDWFVTGMPSSRSRPACTEPVP
jgi:hypothetical protein